MLCPLCGTRKARRGCPALNQTICAVCCGTKRLTEIACTSTCSYLSNATEHPAAIVRRQQERDLTVLLPTIQGLTERQHQLFFVFQSLIQRHKPEGFARLIDTDVAEATATLAATLETAARGVIYEHTAQSATAQRLVNEMKALLAEMRQQGAKIYDHEAARALRAIEEGAREKSDNDTAYITLMGRLLRQNRAAEAEPAPQPTSSLILP
jgi:hypothetical protein